MRRVTGPIIAGTEDIGINIGADTTATFQDGMLVIVRGGVVREFPSIREYVDTVALRGGRVPRGVIEALHALRGKIRHMELETQREERNSITWSI